MAAIELEPAPGLHGVTGEPWPGVRYFSTWRQGGVSQAPMDSLNLGTHVGDDPAAVRENRMRLRRALPDEPVWLEQVHGTAVFDADTIIGGAAPPARDAAQTAFPPAPRADAAVTTRRGRPLAIMTADCLPVVLSDESGTVLGVAHAGWRGLAAGVLENTLDELRRRAPDAHGWRAWIGPGIGPRAFQVGAEVREAFLDRDAALAECFLFQPGSGRWLADLAGLARARLSRAGIGRVEESGECTWTRADRYFSHRRDPGSGRQATLAWLE